VLGKHAGLGKTIRIEYGTQNQSKHFAEADHVVRDMPSVLDVLE
jgi:phosphoglycolate phosphatase-like HAD superfamily hydrolase